MPRGDKTAYTDKQKRKAEAIEDGYRERGVSQDEAERRAWATVNKQDGGGKAGGSGRKSAAAKRPAKSSTAKKGAGAKTASKTRAAKRSASKRPASK